MIRRFLPRRVKKKKIFFLGFNKCGTTSLHYLLKNNGIKSLHHHHKGLYVASIIEQNISNGKDPLKSLSRYEAYSDMILASKNTYIECNSYFKDIYLSYPSLYFIFNDRNPHKLIESRFKHHNFAKLQAAYFNVDTDDLTDIWMGIYKERKGRIEEFFRGKINFINFNIEGGNIQNICDFLSPDYNINSKYYKI